ISKAIMENDPVAMRAEPVLHDLSTRLNASVTLGRAKGSQLTYLLASASPTPLRFDVKVGDNVRNLYATSAGKAVLAGFPPEERKKIVEGLTLTPLTPCTRTSKTALIKDLED